MTDFLQNSDSLAILVGHRADAGVGPDVFGGFYHVDDGIDREDDAHNADWGASASCKGEGKEIAAHWYSGIAYGREDGEEYPKKDSLPGQFNAAVLHQP